MIVCCIAMEVDYNDLTISNEGDNFTITITDLVLLRRRDVGRTRVEEMSDQEETFIVREGASVTVLRIYLSAYSPGATEEIDSLLRPFKSIGTLMVNEYVKPEYIPKSVKGIIPTLHLDFVNVLPTFKEESSFDDFTALETLILQKVPLLGNGSLSENVSMAANGKLKKFKMIGELMSESAMITLRAANRGVKLELENNDAKQLSELIGYSAAITANDIIFNIHDHDIEIEIPENHSPPAVIKPEIFRDIERIDHLIVRASKNKENTYFDDVYFLLCEVDIVRHITFLNIKSSRGNLIDVFVSLHQIDVEESEDEEWQFLETFTFTTDFPEDFSDQLTCIQTFQEIYKDDSWNLTKVRMIITNRGVALDTNNWETLELGVTVSSYEFPGELDTYQVVEIPIIKKSSKGELVD